MLCLKTQSKIARVLDMFSGGRALQRRRVRLVDDSLANVTRSGLGAGGFIMVGFIYFTGPPRRWPYQHSPARAV